MRLPLNITANHHLLFSFVHVSCDLSKKRDINASFENPVGYSWLPLLAKGKINIDEQLIPVAATLPPCYLSIQPLGLGKGVCADVCFFNLTFTSNLQLTKLTYFVSFISFAIFFSRYTHN